MLRVLEKATQTRPANRYQTVQEFWDDLAEAALPKTKRLGEKDQADAENSAHEGRKPSADLAIDVTAEEFISAPPKPRFEPVQAAPPRAFADEAVERRPNPKIVVPVTALHKNAKQESRAAAVRPRAPCGNAE